MRHVAHQTAALGAFAGECVVQPQHLAAGNAGLRQPLQQHIAREAADQLLEYRRERQTVLRAADVVRKALVFHDVRAVQNQATELVELRIGAHRDDEWAIGRVVHAVGHDGRMRVAVALGVMAELERIEAVVTGDHHAAVVQRHLDEAPRARAFAAEQRGQHRLRSRHAGHQIDHGHTEFERRLLLLAVERHEPRFALDHEVVTGSLGLGPAAVVTRDRDVDDVRLDGLELLVSEPQFLRPARLEVVNHHIGLQEHFAHDPDAFRRLQIERHGPLVAVHAVVISGLGLADANAPIARVVTALGMLHLDHLGTEIRQHLTAQRPRENAREIQHADALERQIHILM